MIRIFLFILFGLPFAAHSQHWRDLNGGVDGIVHAMYVDSMNNELYVGGTFQHAGGIFSSCIAKWDSIQWTSIGNDTIKGHPDVRCIVKFNGEIIVGGYFDSIGMVRMNNISRWDGIRWSPMGSGFSDGVLTLIEYRGELYAGGAFRFSGNDTLRYFAKWNGNSWVQLPGLTNLNYEVYAFCIYDSLLIVGGYFNSIPAIANSSRLVAFDGVNWLSMNSPFNDLILTLDIIQDTLYAGGGFTSYPGAPSNYLSKYNGQYWEAIPYPTGGTNWITDMTSYHNQFVVCGYFENPEDLGMFNGTSFDSIGSATGFIYRTCVYKDELYVAGGFSEVGGLITGSIGRFDNIQLSSAPNFTNTSALTLFPNPVTTNTFRIESPLYPIDKISVTITNLMGQSMKINKINNTVYINNLSSGAYFANFYNQGCYFKTIRLIVELP